MSDGAGAVSQLLRAWAGGDVKARDELVPLVYHELRKRASGYLRHERPDHTLQATALVHEAFLRLAGQDRVAWQNRGHFYAVAAQMMRRILVDHARERRAAKRPGAADARGSRRPNSGAGPAQLRRPDARRSPERVVGDGRTSRSHRGASILRRPFGAGGGRRVVGFAHHRHP